MSEDSDLHSGFSGSPVIDDIKAEIVGVVSHRQGAAKGIAIDIDPLELLPSWRKFDGHQKSKKLPSYLQLRQINRKPQILKTDLKILQCFTETRNKLGCF